jgi:hypothetical protein
VYEDKKCDGECHVCGRMCLRTKFPTPVSLNLFDFSDKETFNHRLKLEKNIKDIKFALNWKKPSKSAKSINKGNIVLVPIRGNNRGRTPYI